MALQVDDGQYVSAIGGGGGDVLARGPQVNDWETFELCDLNGGDLQNGDPVSLRTVTNFVIRAEL